MHSSTQGLRLFSSAFTCPSTVDLVMFWKREDVDSEPSLPCSQAKFSPAAVDTGSLICHQLVVTPHLITSLQAGLPNSPRHCSTHSANCSKHSTQSSKNGACVLMKIHCGRAPDTPVKHSVAPLFIPQYLLGAYCIRAPFWMQEGGSDKGASLSCWRTEVNSFTVSQGREIINIYNSISHNSISV